jgi:hypothetical protein
MKRTGLLLLLIPIILFSQFGCVADDSTTLAVDALRKRLNDSDALIATHTTTITQLTAQLAQKATAAEVAAAKADAAAALAKANAMTTPPPATNYESRIAALESWKTSLGAVNPVIPPPVGGTTTGTITTFLDPAAPTVIGNSPGYSFIVRFKNTGTATLYVSPELKATQSSGSAATIVSLFNVTTTTANYPATLTFTVVPAVPTPSGSTVVRAIPIGGGFNNNGSIPVFGNSEVIVTFTVALTQIPLTQWNFTINPSVS